MKVQIKWKVRKICQWNVALALVFSLLNQSNVKSLDLYLFCFKWSEQLYWAMFYTSSEINGTSRGYTPCSVMSRCLWAAYNYLVYTDVVPTWHMSAHRFSWRVPLAFHITHSPSELFKEFINFVNECNFLWKELPDTIFQTVNSLKRTQGCMDIRSN